MQGPITYDLVTVVVTAILLALAGWWRIETAVAARLKPVADKVKEIEEEADADRRNATDQDINNAKDLRDFKVYCANTFVPMSMLSSAEGRLNASINRLEDRVERVPRETVELLKAVFDGKMRP